VRRATCTDGTLASGTSPVHTHAARANAIDNAEIMPMTRRSEHEPMPLVRTACPVDASAVRRGLKLTSPSATRSVLRTCG
jgi:hypothetical protein